MFIVSDISFSHDSVDIRIEEMRVFVSHILAT